MAFMGPSHWLSDPDGAEAASEKEFFGWTGASASAQPFLRWRPRRIAERASAYAGKHDMARAVRMALEAEWDGHEVFFISNKDSRCLRPTREVLERWYAHLSTTCRQCRRAAQISSFPADSQPICVCVCVFLSLCVCVCVLRQVPRHADRRKPGHS